MDGAQKGHKIITVLSNDTDIFVLGLFFWERFMRMGAAQTYYSPLHIVAEKTGPLCEVLHAVYCLTGADCTSKSGSKLAGLNTGPCDFLQDFWEGPLTEEQFTKAELYLVRVLKKGSQ